MKYQQLYKSRAFALWLIVIVGLFFNTVAHGKTPEAINTALVQQAFIAWKKGQGGVFDLLADGAIWTVAGSSPVSGIYATRQEFLEDAVRPIHARLSTAIKPEIKKIISQDNHLVVFWDGSAQTQDGSRYVNSYAWYMIFDGGKIIQVTAFLDTWALNKLME